MIMIMIVMKVTLKQEKKDDYYDDDYDDDDYDNDDDDNDNGNYVNLRKPTQIVLVIAIQK